MYMFFPVILLFALFCAFLFWGRRRRLICGVCGFSLPEKLCRLQKLLAPFGFEYQLSQDVFISRTDAWQREYGYCRLYDEAAPGWGMLFDCEPVYFDYHGRTWLMEFWKGQYGIHIGAEAGIYQADDLLDPNKRAAAFFHTVSDAELPIFDLELYRGTVSIFHITRRHWWLAGFRMGTLAEPEMLSLRVSVTFPDREMQAAFLEGCKEAGISCRDLCVCGRNVSFTMRTPHASQPRIHQPLISAWTRWRNRCFLRLYRAASAPFRCTCDRLLYLFGFLPFFPRRVLCRCQKKQFRKRR